MDKSKIKLIVLFTVLILLGGIIPAIRRISAASGAAQQDQIQGTENGGQKTEFLQTVNGHQSSVLSGREFFYKMLVSLMLVIAFGTGAVYISKKWLPRITNQQGKQIQVLETVYLAPRKGLYLVQAGSKKLLLSSTNETITMLADITEAGQSEEAHLPQTIADFATQLKMRS